MTICFTHPPVRRREGRERGGRERKGGKRRKEGKEAREVWKREFISGEKCGSKFIARIFRQKMRLRQHQFASEELGKIFEES